MAIKIAECLWEDRRERNLPALLDELVWDDLAEANILIVGIGRDEALISGRDFDQNAIVMG
jgi:hypothetical protein